MFFLNIFSFSSCRWVPAEEHRGDESHAEPCQNPRNPGYHEGTIKGDDEGQQQCLTQIDTMKSMECCSVLRPPSNH